MGNILGRRQEDTVDGGFTFPTGEVYSKTDSDLRVIRRLILERKLAPFYKGRADAESEYTIECPICFLYMPETINFSRCCSQPICTECFVQIKHPLTGGPATCPFCAEPEFGIVYNCIAAQAPAPSVTSTDLAVQDEKPAKRRMSLPHTAPNVVTVDIIRPTGRRPLPRTPTESAYARRATLGANSRQQARSAARVVRRTSPLHSSRAVNAATLDVDELLRELALPIPVQMTDNEYWRMRMHHHQEPSTSAAAQPYSSSYTNGDRLRRAVAAEDVTHLADLEDAMIQEALRLSLVEEELRQARERREGTAASSSSSSSDESQHPDAQEDGARRTGRRHSASSNESSNADVVERPQGAQRPEAAPLQTADAIPTSPAAAPASPRTISSSLAGVYETDRSDADNDDASF